jgi:hypothetical protein
VLLLYRAVGGYSGASGWFTRAAGSPCRGCRDGPGRLRGGATGGRLAVQGCLFMNTDIPPASPPPPVPAPVPGVVPGQVPGAGLSAAPQAAVWKGRPKDVALLLSSVHRWAMLRELAATEWLTPGFLARRTGLTRTAAAKHVALLLKKKVIERGPSRLYRLVPALRPPPGADCLDFGPCRLKLSPQS